MLGQLEANGIEAHGIVLGDDALFFFAQDLLEVDVAEGHEGRRRVRGRAGERGVVVGDVLLTQVGVGGGHRGDPGLPQFIDESILERAIDPFAAAAGLGRVRADVFDAEPGEGAADVRQVRAIDGPAGFGRMEGPARAIGVHGEGQAAGAQDVGEGVHDGLQRLARPQLRVEQALGGIVEDRDQGLAFGGPEGEPSVGAAVEWQQFAQARPGLSAPPMAAASAPLGDEPGGLQGQFNERVGQRHVVVAADELMKVPHIEAVVVLTIEPQDPLHLRARRGEVRGALAAAIEQPQHRVLFIPRPPSAQRARMDAEDIGRLQPRESTRQRTHDHLLVRHRSLHGGGNIRHQHLLGC